MRIFGASRGAARARRACGGVLIAALAVPLGACSHLLGSMAASTLSGAILNQSDPTLVKSGLPAYLLLIDGLIQQHPNNRDLLASGAKLFALYGTDFESDPGEAAKLTQKARSYGARSLCLAYKPACHWDKLDYSDFAAQLKGVKAKNIKYLYAYAVGWLAHLQATSQDWTAVAELPWVQAALQRALALDDTYDDGSLHAYMGILDTLRPPAYGGKPTEAKKHFERAIEISHGRDLSFKVEYARRYARMVFNKQLHDRLLEQVLAAPAKAPGLTLFNTLAKQEAKKLLASSGDYF